jgi:hypothetical protein
MSLAKCGRSVVAKVAERVAAEDLGKAIWATSGIVGGHSTIAR